MIIELNDSFSDAWDSFIARHPFGTIFHTSAWKKVIENTFRLKHSYYYYENNSQIEGILPLFITRSLFSGKKIVSIPFAVYGGILADNKDIEKELFNFASNLARKNKANHIEFRNKEKASFNLPELNLYVTYIKELEKDNQSILLSIPRKSRASIRNGYKKFDLTTRIDRDLDTLFRLYSLNKKKLGSPQYPRAFFENLMQEFGEQAGIMTVFTENIPAASVLFFCYRETILPYFSGSDDNYFYTNANNIMYYELMKYAVGKGLKYFDFGRSRKNTGSAKFKENMGFEPTTLHYNFYLSKSHKVPNISPSNSRFNLVTKIWSKLPLTVTCYLGPKIVKYIP